MTGANYMGGKRNAVRARTKDVTSRLQKGHFGKQRLNLLAHGVVRNSIQSLAQKPKATTIDLAHAQRDYPMREPARAYIPQPATPKHPESCGSPSSLSKSSKLLTALEKLEPISFCSKKTRLLKISDFAGLFTKREELAVKESFVCIPGVKRKADDSDVSPRECDVKRTLFQVDNVADGSSSTCLPPSPSPAILPCRPKPPNILPSPASAVYSDISGDDHTFVFGLQNSKSDIYEDSVYPLSQEQRLQDKPISCRDDLGLDQRNEFTSRSCELEDTWKTRENREVSAHLPPKTPPTELIEMSEEWCDMANYLRVNEPPMRQKIGSPKTFQGLGRLGVDFYVFPHLKPMGLDKTVTTLEATDLTPSNALRETGWVPLTPKYTSLPATPTSLKCRNPGPKGSVAWEENSQAPPSLGLPAPSSPNISSPKIEQLEYDTQSESQRSFNYAQLLLDDALLAGASAHRRFPGSNHNVSNNTLSFIVEEPSQTYMPTSPGPDWSTDCIGDPISEESLNQSTTTSQSQSSCPIISCNSPMRSKHQAQDDDKHHPVDLAMNNIVNTNSAVVEYLERVPESVVTTEPETGGGNVSRDVEMIIAEEPSIELDVDGKTFIAFSQSVHPDDSGTTNQIEMAAAMVQDHTGPEEASRGSKNLFADTVWGDDVRPKGLIDGPLLFADENEETEDED